MLASEVNEQLTGTQFEGRPYGTNPDPVFLSHVQILSRPSLSYPTYEKISSISSSFTFFAFFRFFSFDSSAVVYGFGGAKGPLRFFTLTAWRDEGPRADSEIVRAISAAAVDIKTFEK